MEAIRSSGKRVSTAESVARVLRQRIAAGVYPPASLLPPHRRLAEELGAGPVSVLAGIGILADEGLLETQPRRGARVRRPQDRLPRSGVAVVHLKQRGIRAHISQMLRGAHDAFSALGYAYDVVSVPGDALSLSGLLRQYGALLLLETLENVAEIRAVAGQAPMVVANAEEEVDLSATWVNYHDLARGAVHYLAAMGHGRIGFVGREPTRTFHGKARAGYRQGLRDLGLDASDALIGETKASTSLDGYMAARRLLDLDARPSAILVDYDQMAHGVCKAVEDHGLALGRDVSVMGMDDVSWPEDVSYLTTLRRPCVELGAEAARMLACRIVDPRLPMEKRELRARLVVRRSVGLGPEAAKAGRPPIEATFPIDGTPDASATSPGREVGD